MLHRHDNTDSLTCAMTLIMKVDILQILKDKCPMYVSDMSPTQDEHICNTYLSQVKKSDRIVDEEMWFRGRPKQISQ